MKGSPIFFEKHLKVEQIARKLGGNAVYLKEIEQREDELYFSFNFSNNFANYKYAILRKKK